MLEAERAVEQQFAAEAAQLPRTAPGWPPALILFHVSRWRRRLLDDFQNVRAGRAVPAPPADVDGLNQRELAEGRATGLDQASAEADDALRQLIELWSTIGDRPFKWYIADTTGEALVRNSYFHPRNHIAEHLHERGERRRAGQLFEATLSELHKAEAPGHTVGPAMCNLARVRVAEGQLNEALSLLEAGIRLRPDLSAAAARDPGLAPLRNEPRFNALVNG